MSVKLTKQERTITLALAGIFGLRMLGLFMILPVFALSAYQFVGATKQLIGITIGIYGLAQALLQIPLGALSDKYGRKITICMGLFIFLLGSILAASSDSIYGVILGRLLQGSAAIGSVIMATVADYTREQIRTRAMAVVGMVIGTSFAVAIVVGPILEQAFGLRSIFWVTAGCTVLGIILVWGILPKSASVLLNKNMPSLGKQLRELLLKNELLDLNIGVFSTHASLAALFLVLPGLIKQTANLQHNVWQLYLPVLAVAFIVGMLLILSLEKKGKTRILKWIAALFILVGKLLLFTFRANLVGISVSLLCYFIGFSILEANLPSCVSRVASKNSRGITMGLFSSFQFLGIFFGGTMGGWLHSHYGVTAVLIFCILLTLTWSVVASLVKYASLYPKPIFSNFNINSR